MTLMVRVACLPWERSVRVDPMGTLAHGRDLSALSSVGRLPLTVNT
jgi:hypothetical protein